MSQKINSKVIPPHSTTSQNEANIIYLLAIFKHTSREKRQSNKVKKKSFIVYG